MVQVLGSVLDRKLVARVIEQQGFEVIYHAAAYKHVPIVEVNPFAGLQNNTFGTLVVAETARELGVERFVLVSSDKAVRPTNIMGASKRLAEQILQAMALESPSSRAGQLARQQILWGRPIPLEETVARINKIDAARVKQVAGQLFSNAQLSVAGIGPIKKMPDFSAIASHLNG